MPSPNQEMLNALDALRYDELDVDILCDRNSTILQSQVRELLHHEGTSHQELLLFTLLVGMVNQNAILIGQVEALQSTQEELTLANEKTAARLTVVSNKVDRVHDRVGTPPRAAQPPPQPQTNPQRTPRILQRPAQAPPAPPQTSAPRQARTITQAPSYAQAAQDNLRQWEQVTHKKTAPKKKNPTQPKQPKTLPAAQRRFFATRQTPEALKSAEEIAANLSVTFGRFMASQNQVAPVTSLTVTINQRGAVTVLPPPTVPSSVYAPFFEAMTTILNNNINKPENPYQIFRPARTDVDIAIHGIPLFAIKTKEELDSKFPEIFALASGITPITTRFLHTNGSERNSRKTSTVVITVSAEDAARVGPSIRLLSRPRKCTVMWTASPITQCKKCYKFGHPEQGCKQEHHTCPICAKQHTKQEHTCPVNCNSRRFDNMGCCAAVQAKCVNCDGNHASTSNKCPALTALIENNMPKRKPSPGTPAPTAPQQVIESPVTPMEDVTSAARPPTPSRP